MIKRLTGAGGVGARPVANETGGIETHWAQLTTFREREGLLLAKREQWRLALGDDAKPRSAVPRALRIQQVSLPESRSDDEVSTLAGRR
jgi:hypothetical protein